MTQDMINATFEFIGAWMTLRNVLQVRRDKGYAGIYLPAILFFSLWGTWNLYYYPLLDQWLSFVGASCLVAANLAWVLVMLHYGKMRNPGNHCTRLTNHDGPCNGFPRFDNERWCFGRQE